MKAVMDYPAAAIILAKSISELELYHHPPSEQGISEEDIRAGADAPTS